MTGPHLHYDIVITILPFLDSSSLIQFATVCHSYCQPALRRLWQHPRITHPDKLHNFICYVSRSVQQQLDGDEFVPRPYYEWITGLTIAFDSFQPIPLLPTFQSVLIHHLPNLVYLSLHHTHAVFSRSVQRYQAQFCLLEIPISALPGPITTLDHRSDNLGGDNPLPWLDLYLHLGSPTTVLLTLTHISITHSSITGLLLNDTYLQRIALTCPNLRYMRLSGFFSDKGLNHVADGCHMLNTIYFSLPKNFVQSNTITNSSLDRLAKACPHLTRFTCLGQTRIDPALAEQTFRFHCPRFSYCDFGTTV